jgi:hypothetical protein
MLKRNWHSILLGLAVLLLAPLSFVMAGEPISSAWRADVDSDGVPETFLYSLTDQGVSFLGTLEIRSASGTILWSHRWEMRSSDLTDDLLVQEGNISVGDWVSRFFTEPLVYGAKLEHRKLKDEELQPYFIEFYAKREAFSTDQLRAMILSQKTNVLFSYRASWREDLLELVFVPQLNKFIRYGQGEY